MTTIAVPLWILACLAGMPMLSLLGLLGILIKKIRKPGKDMFGNIALQNLNIHPATHSQFHNDLLCQQIDAVFNGINAIVESERLKIQSLLNGGGHMGLNTATLDRSPGAMPETVPQTAPAAKEKETSLEQRIANYSASGNQPDDIANEMGISQSEVELAMTMRSSREKPRDRKLVAVA